MPDYMDQLFLKVKKPKEQKQAPETKENKPAPLGRPAPPEKSAAQTDSKARPKPAETAAAGQAATSLDDVKRKITEMKAEASFFLKGPEIAPLPEEAEGYMKSKTEKEIENSDKSEIDSYGSTKIYKLPGQPLLYYWTPVVRPGGSEKSIINTIKEVATRVISIAPYKIRDPEQRRNVYFQRVLEIIRDSPELNIPKAKYEFYADAVVREMVGYGIIDSLIKDDQLEEIMVIGPDVPVFVFHRKYEMMITNIEFFSDSEIQDLINRIARQIGRRMDISSPLLDARLPDGSRVNATMPPATVAGSTLTIRKFREEPFSIIDLINEGTADPQSAAFLWLATEGLGARPANILISGGTGAGKTTLLNVLATFIPDTDRIITIEDTAELNLPMKHWIRMEARPPGLEGTGELTLDILTKNSLRMRPDRIIVGEVRHDEAFTLFTGFNTGHDGCLAPETKIALTTGIREIGEFTECLFSKNGTWKEGEWEVCDTKGEFINSADDAGKISAREIVQARRKPHQGVAHHIKLASGAELTCTGNHPLFTLKNGEVVQVKAENLAEGMRVATPRKLIREEKASEPETEYWSGLLHGDGHINERTRMGEKNGKAYKCMEGSVNLYAEERETIPKFIEFMKTHFEGTHAGVACPGPEKQCYEAHVSGSKKARMATELLGMPSGNRNKAKMPNLHYTAALREFVAGFFDAEGHVDLNNNALVLSCANENYIDFFRYALLTEGIVSRKYESKSGGYRWHRLYIYGAGQTRKFYEKFPIRFGEKIKKLEEMIGKKAKPNTNVDLIECNSAITRLLELASEKGRSSSEVAMRAGLSQGLLGFYKRNERTPSRAAVLSLAKAFESLGIDASKLGELAEAEIFWDAVSATHSFPYNGFVYDLTVSEPVKSCGKPHNFVAEGIIVGNSMGTVHANSPEETIVRVTNPPMNVPEVMLSGLNFIIVIHRMHDNKRGTIRRITEIAEVVNALRGKPKTNSIYKWDPVSDRLKRTDEAMEYMITISELTGMTRRQIEDEIDRRAAFLSKLVKDRVVNMKDCSKRMKEFIAKRS